MTESHSESTELARLPSEGDREAAVKRLTTAFAEDAIAVDEFERRVAEVWKVTSTRALVALTRDLPAEGASTTAPSGLPARRTEARAVDVPRERSRHIASVLSSIERRVNGTLPERLNVRAVMASVELDLRDADFPPGVTEIRVRAVMGSVEIDLPPHVEVEDYGRSFMGSFAVRGPRKRATRDANAPVVRITGRSIVSSIEVESDDD